MYKKLLIYIGVVCHLSLNVVSAQNDFDLTQRWFNETLYNPAAAGNSFSTGLFLHTRLQWVGISGGPSTHAGTFDTYVENLSSGIGLSFAADKLGSISSQSARLAYAFYFPIGDKLSLSLGLSGGFLFRSRKTGGEEDPLANNVSENSPDFDFGFELRGPLKFGVSLRHIGTQPPKYNLPKHSVNMWAYASSRFNTAEALSVEPLVSFLYNDTYRVEAGALFYFLKNESRNTYNDRFWAGLLYRTGGGGIFALLAGINITPQIRFGYSFDYATGDLASIAGAGTHELFLSFHFNRIFYKDETCPAYRGYRR